VTCNTRRGFAFVVFQEAGEAQAAERGWRQGASTWHVSFAHSDEPPAPKSRKPASESEALASRKRRKNASSLGIGDPTAPWAKRQQKGGEGGEGGEGGGVGVGRT